MIFEIMVIAACALFICSFILSNIIIAIIASILLIVAIFIKRKIERYVSFEDSKAAELHKRLISVFPAAKYIKVSGSNESFTIDKKHIYLCLKDMNGNYYDDNTLMNVLLHEYAHVLCDEFDTDSHKEHGDKFKGIFADLIVKAHKAGIYDPNIPMVEDYCGY